MIAIEDDIALVLTTLPLHLVPALGPPPLSLALVLALALALAPALALAASRRASRTGIAFARSRRASRTDIAFARPEKARQASPVDADAKEQVPEIRGQYACSNNLQVRKGW